MSKNLNYAKKIYKYVIFWKSK
jgi:hypothetical protein